MLCRMIISHLFVEKLHFLTLCDYTLTYGPFPYPRAPLEYSAMSSTSAMSTVSAAPTPSLPRPLHPGDPTVSRIHCVHRAHCVRHVHCIRHTRHVSRIHRVRRTRRTHRANFAYSAADERRPVRGQKLWMDETCDWVRLTWMPVSARVRVATAVASL